MRIALLLLVALSASAQEADIDCEALRREAALYAAAFLTALRANPAPSETELAAVRAKLNDYQNQLASCSRQTSASELSETSKIPTSP